MRMLKQCEADGSVGKRNQDRTVMSHFHMKRLEGQPWKAPRVISPAQKHGQKKRNVNTAHIVVSVLDIAFSLTLQRDVGLSCRHNTLRQLEECICISQVVPIPSQHKVAIFGTEAPLA